ncbi:MAG: cadherin-like beta sandwich domain-containing protein [Kangiellaceae bacterium]|nr:cadherin-like beta sandwich domain-containing protein [Kangiellaceae bacterium]
MNVRFKSRNLLPVILAALTAFMSGCGGGSSSSNENTPLLSTNANLTQISLSEDGMSPSFSSSSTEYTLDVYNDVESIMVTAVTSHTAATLSLNGNTLQSGVESSPVALDVGENNLSLNVVAEDGTTSKTYTISVNRSELLNDDATLAGLSLSTGSLSPQFDSSQFDYSASVAFSVNQIRVTPTASYGKASILVNGANIVSGEQSDEISLAEGENTITISVLASDNETELTYTIRVDKMEASEFAQQAYLKASNTGVMDFFGNHLAMEGGTLVVAATQENSNATGINGDGSNDSAQNSGAVYVFEMDQNNNWTQQAFIKASNTGGQDLFGSSIAISNGVIAVGAIGEGSNATGLNGDQANNSSYRAGAVYLFEKSDQGEWQQTAYLKSPVQGSDEFGVSVALDGELLAVAARNEDGSTVGVNGDMADNNASNSGAVFIYRKVEGVWTHTDYLKPSNTDLDDNFGWKMQLSNGILAVSTYNESSAASGINGDDTDNSADQAGAVYIFSMDAQNMWSQEAYIKPSNTDAADLFGFSLALSENRLAVGSWGEDSASTGLNGDQSDNSVEQAGAVYLFERDANGNWSQQAYLKASNTDESGHFGFSVALFGDLLAVGAYGESGGSTGPDGDQSDQSEIYSGAAYLFQRSADGIWQQRHYIKASNTGEYDHFGNSIVLSQNNLVIGAHAESSAATGINGNQGDDNATYAGAVYVFNLGSSDN